jgi:hypothetical protein
MQHQAQGLQRLFSGHSAPGLISVLAAPHAINSHDFSLSLADALAKRGQHVCLVDTGSGELFRSQGCRPLLAWQANRPLQDQIIRAGAHGLLYAPGCMAGDAAIAAATACRGCDFLLFDGGRFSLAQAPLEPATPQTLVVLLGRQDAEAGYALVKALQASHSPARVLLIGESADSVAQTARCFMDQNLESLKSAGDLYQIDNTDRKTSSNTLTIEPNLSSVVSRIMENDQPKVAHGGCGKGAEEIYY